MKDINKENLELIGFQCMEECTLDGTNFGYEEVRLLPEEADHDWKGVVFFEKYPQIFRPIYAPIQTD